MTELTELSAARMAAAVRAREVSPVELVDAQIARIEALDPALNAVAVPRFEQARAEARSAERLDPAALGPLAGVPFTAKEAIESRGDRCVNGSRVVEPRFPDRDAPAIANLRAAGAILVAKTNISEMCAHYDSDNPVYGRTRNPHDPERTPGGSSGGEAAAIAACMSPLGAGSDLGSSIRQPAAWCGVAGLKPTRDRVSPAGHAGFGLPPGFRLFSAIGPMARTVEDLELGLAAMSGRPLEPVRGGPRRIAVYEDDGLQAVAASCRKAVRRAALALSDAGHELIEERPPSPGEVRAAYDTMLATELSLFTGPLVAGREAELSPVLRDMLEELSGFPRDLTAYLDAGRRLAALEAEADRWFQAHPVALSPVTPVPAPPAAEGITTIDGEPARPGGKLTLCTFANALGLPSVSIPVMREPGGLPVGVLLTGRYGSDAQVLALARELETALGGWLDPRDSPRSALRSR